MATIVERIQMKIHKSMTVVSEAQSLLYKMISWNIALHIIFVEFWKIYWKNLDYCTTSKDGDRRHPIFGFAILSPVLLSTIFVLVHWWKTESNLVNKLVTLPLVIGQTWPQYRIVRILYFGLIKKNRLWKVENEAQKKNVSSLGMFWIWSYVLLVKVSLITWFHFRALHWGCASNAYPLNLVYAESSCHLLVGSKLIHCNFRHIGPYSYSWNSQVPENWSM